MVALCAAKAVEWRGDGIVQGYTACVRETRVTRELLAGEWCEQEVEIDDL